MCCYSSINYNLFTDVSRQHGNIGEWRQGAQSEWKAYFTCITFVNELHPYATYGTVQPNYYEGTHIHGWQR